MNEKTPLLMDIQNSVYLEGGRLVIIDRRKLPREIAPLYCEGSEDVARAIEDMAVQGAGDIAVAAGFGLYLTARELEKTGNNRDMEALEAAAERFRATRPTGFILPLLLKNALKRVVKESGAASDIILHYLKEVVNAAREVSEATGRHAEKLLDSGDRILTHCFPGPALLYMLKYAKENGKDIKVVCTETRPYLQGARLTAWSVSNLGLDATIITDNMAAHFMSRSEIDKVFTAADRIAMDGTVANKIGTLQLAICSGYFDVPFYVLGYGGHDRNTAKGSDIPIEERNPEEVLYFQGVSVSSKDVKARYPAFDLTPPELITAIVTQSGIESLRNKLRRISDC
jgi:methylthioribose-1-phosphate isomerase